MKRRDFITLLGSAAAAWPLAARAQQGERIRRIGVLMGLSESDPEAQSRIAAFRKTLQDLGWTEARNVCSNESHWGLLRGRTWAVPTRSIFCVGCCARATTGQPAAPVARSVMNSRLFNRSNCIRWPTNSGAAYRIGEDQVSVFAAVRNFRRGERPNRVKPGIASDPPDVSFHQLRTCRTGAPR